MSGSSPYQVPKAPGRWRAIALALIVHLALVAFLWIGVSWQNKTPLAVEAEIWDPQIKEAAPLPQPEPQPELPQPTPSQAAPVPEPQATPPKAAEPILVKPDIALEKEKEKKRKEQEQRDAALEKQAKQARDLQAKRDQEKREKIDQEKQAKTERLKKEKQEDDKKLAKQKEDADAMKKAEADKLAAEKLQKQAAADNKAAQQRRQEETNRLLSQATSSSGGVGTAAKSQGPRGDAGYAGKIAARIRMNTTFDVPPGLAGNPPVEYAVELLPDGSIRSVRLIQSSNLPGFDEAVARAINKSQPFPPDKDGKVPTSISVIHKPKDNN